MLAVRLDHSLCWHFCLLCSSFSVLIHANLVLFPFDNIHTIPECIHHFCFECASQPPLARQLLFDMYLFVFIIRSNNRHPSDWRDEWQHFTENSRKKRTHRKNANEDIMVPKHSSIKHYYSPLCCSIHQCSAVAIKTIQFASRIKKNWNKRRTFVEKLNCEYSMQIQQTTTIVRMLPTEEKLTIHSNCKC